MDGHSGCRENSRKSGRQLRMRGPCHTTAHGTPTQPGPSYPKLSWGLWTSLALERPSCLIPVLHTGWCGGKRSAGAWESYHRILISHNQQQGQAFH